MDQQPAAQTRKPTPWISALYSSITPLAGLGYFIWIFFRLMEKAREGIQDAELTREIWQHTWIVIPFLITALLAGFINIIFVVRGGRKWTLIFSITGVLLNLGALAFLGKAWVELNGK
jgi:ABC-type proline/glycine betaine transport system permease subunit